MKKIKNELNGKKKSFNPLILKDGDRVWVCIIISTMLTKLGFVTAVCEYYIFLAYFKEGFTSKLTKIQIKMCAVNSLFSVFTLMAI